MDFGSTGALASFTYTQALQGGAPQAKALQQAFQVASSATSLGSTLLGSGSPASALLDASFQGTMTGAGYALAQQAGQGTDFLASQLASASTESAISTLFAAPTGGMAAVNLGAAEAMAAYEYQLAQANGTQQAYLQQFLSASGINLLG